jgi:hypothetical protein
VDIVIGDRDRFTVTVRFEPEEPSVGYPGGPSVEQILDEDGEEVGEFLVDALYNRENDTATGYPWSELFEQAKALIDERAIDTYMDQLDFDLDPEQ